MSITHRRSLQARFASRLTDEQIAAVSELNRRLDVDDQADP